jgi:hypothetical protein
MPDYAYMAFLDILGYKNLLNSDINQGTQVFKNKMITAFRVFDSVNQATYAYKAISDSIFIVCQNRESAEDLLKLLRSVFVAFLNEGLLIRGGVSYGEHFQNQTITYSPVLTKAYNLESTIADFPRIMIDANIIDMFPTLKDSRIALRTGNYWYLNIATEENYQALWSAAEITFNASKQEIENSEKVRIKHKWLQDYLIEVADCYGIPRNTPYLNMFDDLPN